MWEELYNMPQGTYYLLSILVSAIQLGAIIIAAIALKRQTEQTKLAIQNIDQQQNRIFVTTFTSFAGMYLDVMASVPMQKGKSKMDASEISSWWYRYWDIVTAEIHFYRLGHLDKITFELWMRELASKMDHYPHNQAHMGTFRDRLHDRKKLLSGIDNNVHDFLVQIEEAAAFLESDPEKHRLLVNQAIRTLKQSPIEN